jgi:hypothetical protein
MIVVLALAAAAVVGALTVRQLYKKKGSHAQSSLSDVSGSQLQIWGIFTDIISPLRSVQLFQCAILPVCKGTGLYCFQLNHLPFCSKSSFAICKDAYNQTTQP